MTRPPGSPLNRWARGHRVGTGRVRLRVGELSTTSSTPLDFWGVGSESRRGPRVPDYRCRSGTSVVWLYCRPVSSVVS